jgi:hypothetical protein
MSVGQNVFDEKTWRNIAVPKMIFAVQISGYRLRSLSLSFSLTFGKTRFYESAKIFNAKFFKTFLVNVIICLFLG